MLSACQRHAHAAVARATAARDLHGTRVLFPSAVVPAIVSGCTPGLNLVPGGCCAKTGSQCSSFLPKVCAIYHQLIHFSISVFWPWLVYPTGGYSDIHSTLTQWSTHVRVLAPAWRRDDGRGACVCVEPDAGAGDAACSRGLSHRCWKMLRVAALESAARRRVGAAMVMSLHLLRPFAVMYHINTLARQLAPVTLRARLCHARAVLQAVLAALLDRVDAALVDTAPAGGGAGTARRAVHALAGGAAPRACMRAAAAVQLLHAQAQNMGCKVAVHACAALAGIEREHLDVSSPRSMRWPWYLGGIYRPVGAMYKHVDPIALGTKELAGGSGAAHAAPVHTCKTHQCPEYKIMPACCTCAISGHGNWCRSPNSVASPSLPASSAASASLLRNGLRCRRRASSTWPSSASAPARRRSAAGVQAPIKHCRREMRVEQGPPGAVFSFSGQ
ncbi:hypothetical protein GGX14DRAFT_402594 [Mycena pura]|uniref:Uncharacterized protein n=1 Tax=Mycena pura TaxID=153505 RepID=A0AAD6V000_9AGAR|nr:hypothetical protein GGX14DRAFT_402593 [Mycena pura]KAJ7197359.1 hypothetical protein GGX14DRAFT_402594 [Mycena pura]